ncbi:GspH/FimT family pseudopilin [Solemya velum gill symbiont]|uniref:GspH/FimT family pseudopilin n=2 Tax=Solemya velum gill symbiont TaxID=2340 RepID=UPI000995F688|nr:GspH/FimT family pseudopilin [Solemya velum gill symbiont]OOY99377.1 hypothetical protein BOW19_04530 [Solemya velum gill symbiont]OOZ01545.1 hypothetical protein BOW20_04530 [Solemya velum gill symbiont]OOZ03910.1 hypothetical protein BOW21_04760 [Solemya velum gill symbiont]OOZ06135.1 hypothetical protein BOW22_04745 [Solemya velum gill symbiont]OOZ08321.1 hypothetical protein BOW23_04520 [Solemya velum gill symbiont]
MMVLPKFKGFTLIELMIVMVVLAVILILAVPAFQEIIERRQLQRAGENIYSAIMFTKSEAVKQATNVSITFTQGAGGVGWCYGIDDDTSTTCNCISAAANCTLYTAVKTFSNGVSGGAEPFKNVDLDSNVSLTFTADYGKATVNTATVSLESENGDELNVEIDSDGRRIRIESDLPGYTDP